MSSRSKLGAIVLAIAVCLMVFVAGARARRGGGAVTKVTLYMDTADLSGGRYAWDTGNTGASGKFYARAGKIPGCKADTSKTVRTHK
jgi:hypothetical protein